MHKNFLAMLSGLNTTAKINAAAVILRKFETGAASDNKFYSNQTALKKASDELFSAMNTTDQMLEALIRVCTKTPYNIFQFVLEENYSDLMIHKFGVRQMNGKTGIDWVCPEEQLKIFHLFVQSLVKNVTFLSGQKFDPANSVLDAEISNMRFNMLHESLTNVDFPVLVIRKQTIQKGFQMSDSYIDSLGCSEEQIAVIRKFAERGNFILFGETGSGKTTLLKYMASWKLDQKSNLCIIEDTSELNIATPISLVTNNHKNIKALFTATLRENPSHVIIGETRTDEIIDILESALTISVGTTIHANSFSRAIERIIFMSISRHIATEEVKSLIMAAVDCFIFMENRKVKDIWVRKPNFYGDIYQAYEKVKGKEPLHAE